MVQRRGIKRVAGTVLVCSFPPSWGIRVIFNLMRVRAVPFLLGNLLARPQKVWPVPLLIRGLARVEALCQLRNQKSLSACDDMSCEDCDAREELGWERGGRISF